MRPSPSSVLSLFLLAASTAALAAPTALYVVPAAPSTADAVVVHYAGDTPTPCHAVEKLDPTTELGRIDLGVRVKDPGPGVFCITVLGDYEESSDLGRLAAGEYELVFSETRVFWSGLPYPFQSPPSTLTFTVRAADSSADSPADRWSQLKALYTARD